MPARRAGQRDRARRRVAKLAPIRPRPIRTRPLELGSGISPDVPPLVLVLLLPVLPLLPLVPPLLLLPPKWGSFRSVPYWNVTLPILARLNDPA